MTSGIILAAVLSVANADAPVCRVEVCPERMNDLVWENDKFGMRAYGPGEWHRWSGFDVFNKGRNAGSAVTMMHNHGKCGDWHDTPWEGVLDNYTMGASRGVGGIAHFADGEWKTYPGWESCRVLHTGDDYLEFEVTYPACSGAGKMTCRITLRRGERFFRNDVTFDCMPEGFAAGPGLDLEPKRGHAGSLFEDAASGIVSLFENPKGPNGLQGSTMAAVFPAPGQSFELRTDHQNCRILCFRTPTFSYYAGASWSLAGEITTPADWHRHVREFLAGVTARATGGDAAQSPVDALADRLPQIFRNAASQYRRVLKNMEREPPDRLPGGLRNGTFVSVPPVDWTSGFFPGALWYLHEATGDEALKAAAVAYTERLIEPLRHDASNHDVGFRTYCSAGNALRLTGERRYADFLHDTAAALRTRYDDGLGLIRSWDTESKWTKNCFTPEFIVIIDNMMNLELLEWDAKNGGDAKSDRIARSQADLTDAHHFRADGSAYHILGYNPLTRKIQAFFAGQGASADGAWARGQAWAIYGFSVMYRETRDRRYLVRACKAADYWLDEPNLPKDGVPYWDFKAADLPNEERDASAAAVTASALLELSEFTSGARRARYFAAARKILTTLSSPAYTAAEGTNAGYLLLHSVGNKPGNSEIDAPLTYADYYYLEALLRYRRLTSRTVAPFAPGERVAFLGDSITRQAWYLGYLQLHANLAVAGEAVNLVNVGVSGDTAAGALERYDWDVKPVAADRFFVMFGMNDVNVTLYDGKSPDAPRAAERERALAAYARNLRVLVDRLRADGRKVVLMTPTPYDEYAQTNDGTLFRDANEQGLSRCAEIVRRLAAEERIPCIDLHRPLTQAWKAAPEPGYTHDRVHPTEAGARLVAAEILNAMGVEKPALPTNGAVHAATMARCQTEGRRRILPQVRMDIARRGGNPADRASFEATVKAWRRELESRTDCSEKDRRHYLDYFTDIWNYYRKETFHD